MLWGKTKKDEGIEYVGGGHKVYFLYSDPKKSLWGNDIGTEAWMKWGMEHQEGKWEL